MKTTKMNTENTSTEGVTDIKVEKESDDEVEREIDLYADHEIKEELVIGPVVLQRVVNATNYCEDVLAPKKPKLERKDEKTEQVERHQKDIIEDNTMEIVSNVIKKKWKKVINNEQRICYNLRKYKQTPGILSDDCGNKFTRHNMFCSDKMKQDNDFKCKECTFQTGSQDSLEQHYKLHDIDHSFICDLCGYRSEEKYKLLKHLKLKHSLLNKDSKRNGFACSMRDYRYARKNNLVRHVPGTVEKPYSCSKCEYKCISKAYLSKHLRTHTREKPFSCSECEYKCAFKSVSTNATLKVI